MVRAGRSTGRAVAHVVVGGRPGRWCAHFLVH
jgi:hypothetical protein